MKILGCSIARLQVEGTFPTDLHLQGAVQYNWRWETNDYKRVRKLKSGEDENPRAKLMHPSQEGSEARRARRTRQEASSQPLGTLGALGLAAAAEHAEELVHERHVEDEVEEEHLVRVRA